MKTSNHILKTCSLNELDRFLSNPPPMTIKNGGRYIEIREGKWVTANSVASRINALSKSIKPQDIEKFERVVNNFIVMDKRGYKKLEVVIEQADPKKAEKMITARFFKTLFSTSPEIRHAKLQALVRTPPPVKKTVSPIDNALNHAHGHVDRRNKEPLNQMKTFYAKVLETSNFRSKQLDGYTQSGALLSYLQDLKDYRKVQNGPVEKLDEVIKELEFAYKISLTEILSPRYKVEAKARIINQIQEKIKNLEPESFVLIPGGSEGHGIMYKVEKANNGSLSFTMINTGEGADINVLGSIVSFIQKGRLIVQDVTYTNLTIDHFSTEFLSSIMTKNFKNMDQTNEFVQSSLRKTGDEGWKYGRKRKAQDKGSCAFKNVSTTLHEKLGKDEYNRFKTFVTQKEIDKLEKLTVPVANQEIKAQMLSKGRVILQHRASKIR